MQERAGENRFSFPAGLWGGSGRDAPKVLKRIDARVVTIPPSGLERIAPHLRQSNQFKRIRSQWPFRVLINITQNIHLAFAPGAGTTPAQSRQRNIAFLAISPFDGQFFANALEIEWTHDL